MWRAEVWLVNTTALLAGIGRWVNPLPWYSGGGLGWGFSSGIGPFRQRGSRPPPLPSPGVPGGDEIADVHRPPHAVGRVELAGMEGEIAEGQHIADVHRNRQRRAAFFDIVK